MYFSKYRLRKTWLDKCLKSHVSEDPYTDNMENWSKQSSNLNDRIISKTKNFSEFFMAFLKSILNSKHLPEKDDGHS